MTTTGGDIDCHADSGIVRRGYLGASLGCAVLLATGLVALCQQAHLARLTHTAIHHDAVNSSCASRAALSALECRRYEKDLFLNLDDRAAKARYLCQWNHAWEALHRQLEQMRRSEASNCGPRIERCLAAAVNYRQVMREIVARIDQGQIASPAEANRAITPFKEDFRKVARDTAAIADEYLAQADHSGTLLERSVLWNLATTALLVVLPSGLIIVWTVLLTRAIATRNVRLVQARQEAEAANRAKSAFLANMSHELRTPMTAILGYADMLLADVREPEAHEAAATIKRNGDCLLRLINDILDLSKIESGRLTVACSRCSPTAVVAEVLSLMRVRADAKNIALRAEYPGPLPETICTDAARLRQILINLVGNAIKFTEQGTVRLRVQMLPVEGASPQIEFQVIDTGIGMTDEQCARLFQRFSQVHGELNEHYGGTGLGLAISKRLAEMLRGTVYVQSEVGRGSTFTLVLDPGSLVGVPMVEQPSEALDAARRSPRQAAPQIRLDCRVLLAEDGPDNQRLIALLLRKAGAEVTTAENGQVALQLATAAVQAASPYDVILMDMQMPVVDGYEATRRLRAQGYHGPIVALTAHAMFDDRQKCLNAGCNDYITKPVDRDVLLATVLKHRQTSTSGQG